MNRNTGNYMQSYYQNPPENYEDYYQNEFEELQGNCGDASSLQVPNARLYAEGVQEVTGAYTRNSSFYNSPQQMELSNGPCRRSTATALPAEYYYNVAQSHNFGSPAGNDRKSSTQHKPNVCHYRHCNQYSAYQDNISHSPQEGPLIHDNSVLSEVHPEGAYEDNYYPETNQDHIQDSFKKRQSKSKACTLQKNCADLRRLDGNPRNEFIKDVYVEHRARKYYGYGNKISRVAAIKKYPVTVKTPKYITKNFIPSSISKRPSALCLSMATQPDPVLVKRKIKTNHQTKPNSAPSESFPANMYDQSDNYPAHKMHSQGDVNNRLSTEGLETFLDKYEREPDELYNVNQKTIEEKNNKSFKEFAKFLKPRVPSSIKVKQEKLADIKSPLLLQPKLKLSLDKLLNRLQKCEKSDNIENVSELSCKTELEEKGEKYTDNKEVNINTLKSFNYEALTRKCSTIVQNENRGKVSSDKSSLKKRTNMMFGSSESKRSLGQIKLMDDHCALDLHRSKSYIVDLIDRALSKELGTVPRDQSVHHDLSPKKAVATISRHRQSSQKELCYKVTAALTDSIISNASAPPRQDSGQIVERSTSDGQIKGDDNYIKQLKQLRWGHIRHIQHEAKKLADLEEFLEKCGEIEY